MDYNREWIAKETGKLLKELRKESGFSQGDVAKMMGYTSNQFISNLERGVSPPSPQIIRQLLSLFRSKKKATSIKKLLKINMKYLEAELKGKKVA